MKAVLNEKKQKHLPWYLSCAIKRSNTYLPTHLKVLR